MKWHPYPEVTPPVDDDGDSPYLLVACDKSVVPVAGYYMDGGGFYMIGCPQADPLRNVRAWAEYPRLPAELFNSPSLLKYARAGGVVIEENEMLDTDALLALLKKAIRIIEGEYPEDDERFAVVLEYRRLIEENENE